MNRKEAAVPKEIERAERFARKLEETYGPELVSVVLYGSAARGEYREGVSDLNLLVLLRSASAPALRRGSALAREWAEDDNPPPMILSEEEWRGSADVFPIEISDIRDAHRVLHGADPVTGMAVDRAHLRAQCESELKGKQIQLREAYLLAQDDPDALDALLEGSFPTFVTLFRAVLRLEADGAEARDTEAVVRRVAARAGFDPEPLLEIHTARRDGVPLDPSADDPLVDGYLDAVAAVVRYVDRLDGAAR